MAILGFQKWPFLARKKGQKKGVFWTPFLSQKVSISPYKVSQKWGHKNDKKKCDFSKKVVKKSEKSCCRFPRLYFVKIGGFLEVRKHQKTAIFGHFGTPNLTPFWAQITRNSALNVSKSGLKTAPPEVSKKRVFFVIFSVFWHFWHPKNDQKWPIFVKKRDFFKRLISACSYSRFWNTKKIGFLTFQKTPKNTKKCNFFVFYRKSLK